MVDLYRRLERWLSEAANHVYSSIATGAVFFILSLIPVALPATMAVVLYASNAIQLVSMALLGVSGAFAAEKLASLIVETHDTVMSILARIVTFAKNLQDALALLHEAVELLHEKQQLALTMHEQHGADLAVLHALHNHLRPALKKPQPKSMGTKKVK